MTTREASFDHAAEARRYLGLIPASLHADEVIAVAQVHAQLAIAEQARIANLIALFNLGEPDIDDLAFDVAKALGVPRGVRKEPDND